MKSILKEFESYKMYDDEEFKFLIYPGVGKYRYVISNHGRVFSVIYQKELKYHLDKDGYRRIGIVRTLSNGKRSKSPIGIHRMVAFTFLEEVDGHRLVNHKNGNKQDNYYKNLEWSTPLLNTQHAIMMGLQINSGVNCPSAVYTEDTVRTICTYLETGMDCKEIYTALTGNQKVDDNRAFYALIFSIKSGKRHRGIASEYDIPLEVISKSRKKFTDEEVNIMIRMIREGSSNLEICKSFGAKNTKDKLGRRISDKLKRLRKREEMFID